MPSVVQRPDDRDEARIKGRTRKTDDDSIALALMPVEAQPLRPHALDLLIQRVDFLVVLRALRFRGIVATQLFERFLNRELVDLSHGQLSHLKESLIGTG
jgi:hypothetical protein